MLYSLLNMLITDLKQPCKRCGSSGFDAGYDEYGSLHAKLLPICINCNGRGYVLTKLGREVWNLLKPMIVDLLNELEEKNAGIKP